jgi:hypothetical protein
MEMPGEDNFVLSGFCREVDDNYALLGYYAASNGNSLVTFRSHRDSWPLKMGPIGRPETSLRNYQYSLYNSLEERSFQGYCFLYRFAAA